MFTRICSILLILIAIAFETEASPRHEIRFVQAERLVVWQNETLIGQGGSVSLSPQASQLGVALAGSGRLESISGLTPSTENGIRVKIASNTGFKIQVEDLQVAGEIQARLVGMGANANAVLRDPQKASGHVFHQTEKTASRPGAPASQAIEVEISWSETPPSHIRIISISP